MNKFLTKDNFWKKFQSAKQWTDQWSNNFDEFARIARNEAPANVPEQYANVSDGSTAALIRKTPKRVIQQLPTGVVTSDDDDDWLPIVAEFILLHKIIPYANTDYDLIQKCWTTVENGLAFGGQAVYTPFVKHNGEFTTDASLIYYGDIFFQEGKKSLYSCDYFFVRSWWQPETIDQIIENDKEMAASAKKSGVEYKSTWDIKALKKVKESVTSKEDKALTESESKAGVNPSGIEVIMGFQKGVGAVFLTGCPSGAKGGTIIREKKNKDPRGLPPVDYFYADVDGSNPFGRSIIELTGGIQNMIDGDMRAYMFNRALGLAPPLLVYGNVDTSQAIYEANALIEMGDDPKNKLEPLSVDTSALTQYTNIYTLNKTQLLNLFNSGGDTSISSSQSGDSAFGKTPTALKQQKEIMSADDNYLRKNFESFFENWAETAINVYFAEREGIEVLQLDNRTAGRLRDLEKEGKLEEGFVDENNKIRINYSEATPVLKFRVDASTSKLNGQSEQLEALQLLLQMAATQSLSQIVPTDKLAAAWNRIVSNSGVNNPEDLTVELEQYQEGAEPQEGEVPTEQGEVLEGAPAEEENVEPVEPVAAEAEEPEDSDTEVVKILRQMNVPDQIIIQALQDEKRGVPAEQIVARIGRLVNGR